LGKAAHVILVCPTQGFYNGVKVQTHTSSVSEQQASWVVQIRAWARELGFSQIGISDVNLSHAEPQLLAWLDQGFHGSMNYMARHGSKRARPAELIPGTVRVLTLRMDYLPAQAAPDWAEQELQRLKAGQQAVVSLYARGRDYHKVMRLRLELLAQKIRDELAPPDLQYRVFTDSAPVMEVALAARSGLGWQGKHTLLLNREAGSMFFLGEVFVNFELPVTEPAPAHCGHCQACMEVCPTRAIVGPHQLDARRCISYLTIEHKGSIPEDLRPLIGNRIYGCDDCQLVCPWNKFAQRATLSDFDERQGLGNSALVELMAWSANEFLMRTEGSAIRRIGHVQWLRNIAVAMGNALRLNADTGMIQSLQQHLQHPDEVVREHVQWALAQTDTERSAR
jgi:epoxyqueuosine reductase